MKPILNSLTTAQNKDLKNYKNTELSSHNHDVRHPITFTRHSEKQENTTCAEEKNQQTKLNLN